MSTQRTINAHIVADSITERGCRLTTFILVFPRFILAELNTHRMFSRNSASSRARPFKVMLKDVVDDPFIPIKWMSAHKGMQGTEYLNEVDSLAAVVQWMKSRDLAIQQAIELDKLQVTKQLVNRILEPYMWHEVIVTATDYENFFALRAHRDAEIHIAALAEEMLLAYNKSTPKLLRIEEWHIPFGDHFDHDKLVALVDKTSPLPAEEQIERFKKEIASARCARISYKPFGGEDQYDYSADRKLFEALCIGGHMSPLEHCARVMTDAEFDDRYANGYCGNFRGFVQYRKMFVNESRADPRVENKTKN